VAERRPAVPPQVLLDRCTGCGACVAACIPDAISLLVMESGAKKAHVEAVACHLHGDCLAACPHEALFAWKWQHS
jgi:heterodisulfide reductase subunit A-like polyferredoxin